MKSKVFIFDREMAATQSAAMSAPGFKYDFGAKIFNIQPGQTATLRVEKTSDGAQWEALVRFEIDDATELTARQVYVDSDAVRVVVESRTGGALLTAWMREVD